MSDSENQKTGFELDVVDISSLSIPKLQKKEEKETAAEPEKKQKSQEEPATKVVSESIPVTKKSISPIIWVGILFIIVGTLLFFLYTKTDPLPLAKSKKIPLTLNQSILTFAESTEKMQKTLKHIDNISNRINSKQKIANILDVVKIVENHFPVYQSDKQKFINNLDQFQKELKQEGNDTLIAVEKFYQKNSDRVLMDTLNEFLAIQKKYLTYFYNNYDKIHKKQQPQIYTYEKYYLEYTRAIEKYDQASELENKAIHQILMKHPNSKKLFLLREGTAIFKID